MKLNLEATTKEQELIKAYLEENASETLAEKINNGTPFQKNGKTFINRKTLDGFINYASNEARKLASKGANSACVEDKVVYGWAMHYFEEDAIEGTLFNADGSTYQKQPAPQHKPAPKPQPAPQISMFELMEENKPGADEQEQEELSQEEKREILQELAEEAAGKSQLSPLWQKYTQIQDKLPGRNHSDAYRRLLRGIRGQRAYAGRRAGSHHYEQRSGLEKPHPDDRLSLPCGRYIYRKDSCTRVQSGGSRTG